MPFMTGRDKRFKQIVRKIWHLENKDEHLTKKTGYMVGDGCLEIVMVTGNGYITRFFGEAKQWDAGIYLGGQIDRPSALDILPATKLTVLKLQPWAAGLLSTFDFRQSLNVTIPFAQISPQITRVMTESRTPKTGDYNLNLLLRLLEQRLSAYSDLDFLRLSSQRLERQFIDFRTAKKEILSTLAVSSKTLENKFGKVVGLSPQKFANTIRFRQIGEHLIHKTDPTSLTSLAHQYGFYDQAHFTRSCKRVMGMPPSKLDAQNCFITNSAEDFRYYTI